MRLIDADALNGYELGLISPKAQKLFHKIINDAPTQKTACRMSEWIPVSERYPEDGQRVLVDYCDEDFGIMLIRFNVNGYRGFKAWMPLPERFESNAK